MHGLTTAANIWLTAGLGTAVGLGRLWLAVMGSVLAFCVLALTNIDANISGAHGQSASDD